MDASAADRCAVCPWLLSLILLGFILALSVFGAGIVVGQWLASDEAACIVRAWR